MRYLTLFVALALCATASTVLAVDAPAAVALPGVGAFMLFTPGLLLVHALALPDRLLALVVGLLAGPTLWVLVATLQLFAGLWAPRATVLWAAGGFGLLTLVLAVRGLRREVEADEASTHAPRVEQYAVEDGE